MGEDYESHVTRAEFIAAEVLTSENANVDGVLANGCPPTAVIKVSGNVVITHERVRIAVLNDWDRRECLWVVNDKLNRSSKRCVQLKSERHHRASGEVSQRDAIRPKLVQISIDLGIHHH